MSGGIFLPNSGSSSTQSFRLHPISDNVQETNRNNSTASGLPPEYYNYLINEIQGVKSSVCDLKKTSEQSKTFFKESVFLQRVCLTIIVLLPIILTTVVAVVAWFFCTDPELQNCAKNWLTLLGISGLIDLIFIFVTYKINIARIEQIERRLDKLDS